MRHWVPPPGFRTGRGERLVTTSCRCRFARRSARTTRSTSPTTSGRAVIHNVEQGSSTQLQVICAEIEGVASRRVRTPALLPMTNPTLVDVSPEFAPRARAETTQASIGCLAFWGWFLLVILAGSMLASKPEARASWVPYLAVLLLLAVAASWWWRKLRNRNRARFAAPPAAGPASTDGSDETVTGAPGQKSVEPQHPGRRRPCGAPGNGRRPPDASRRPIAPHDGCGRRLGLAVSGRPGAVPDYPPIALAAPDGDHASLSRVDGRAAIHEVIKHLPKLWTQRGRNLGNLRPHGDGKHGAVPQLDQQWRSLRLIGGHCSGACGIQTLRQLHLEPPRYGGDNELAGLAQESVLVVTAIVAARDNAHQRRGADGAESSSHLGIVDELARCASGRRPWSSGASAKSPQVVARDAPVSSMKSSAGI